MKAWVLGASNSDVTDCYLQTIADSLIEAGCEAEFVPAGDTRACLKGRASKKDWFVSSNPIEACRISAHGIRRIILWCQGVAPEESYLRNGSKIRLSVLSFIEKTALKKASLCFFVSEEMRRHYEGKYGLDFEGRYFVMPCFNSALDWESFRAEGKYTVPTFAYVGSLAKWQCFEETVDLYKDIESRLEGSCFKVLTFDREKAEEILRARGVRRFEVDCVARDQVSAELSSVAFGFVVREDNVVNRVATPTKLSSYMAAGVIPVYSDCLASFADIAEDLRFAISVGNPVDADMLVEHCRKMVGSDADDVLAEYKKVFETYYSRDYYMRKLVPILKGILDEDGRI